jgi:AcrR family transcriptional regulator
MSRTLTRKEKQAKTRSALLRSATKLICRKGISEASVEDVATDAGYTKGAFYANFKSKEELFLVMLDEKYAAELEQLENAVRSTDSPADDARHAAEDFIRLAWSDPQWPKLYFEFTVYAARNPDFRQELLTRDRRIRQQIAEIFRSWAADFGVQPSIPVEDLAMMVFCMANGFLMGQLIEPDLGEELYGSMAATFFSGVAVSALGLDLGKFAESQDAKSRKAGAGR